MYILISKKNLIRSYKINILNLIRICNYMLKFYNIYLLLFYNKIQYLTQILINYYYLTCIKNLSSYTIC